jgi:hypothetical protein
VVYRSFAVDSGAVARLFPNAPKSAADRCETLPNSVHTRQIGRGVYLILIKAYWADLLSPTAAEQDKPGSHLIPCRQSPTVYPLGIRFGGGAPNKRRPHSADAKGRCVRRPARRLGERVRVSGCMTCRSRRAAPPRSRGHKKSSQQALNRGTLCFTASRFATDMESPLEWHPQ